LAGKRRGATPLGAVVRTKGRYILVNGMISNGEWDRAASIQLDPETQIRAKMDRESLFLAIVFEGPRHTGVDLYLKSAGKLRLLHISSATGQKEFRDGQWSEMKWGRNHWGTANIIGHIVKEGKTSPLEPEAFEFQLARAELGRDVEVYLHLKRPEKRFRWVHLRMSRIGGYASL